jgi:hypothetical protein
VHAGLEFAFLDLLKSQGAIEFDMQLPLLQVKPVMLGSRHGATLQQGSGLIEQRLCVPVVKIRVPFARRELELTFNGRDYGKTGGGNTVHLGGLGSQRRNVCPPRRQGFTSVVDGALVDGCVGAWFNGQSGLASKSVFYCDGLFGRLHGILL